MEETTNIIVTENLVTTAEPIEVNEAAIPNENSITEPMLPQKPEDDAKASVGSSIINMTNNVLGSGLVALAFVVSKCSLVPGILLLLTVGLIACLSQIIIARSCVLTQKYTYKEMGNELLGKVGGFIISLIMLCYTLCSCISYFIIIGDLFTLIFSFFFPNIEILHNRALVVGTICAVCIFPLCMMKTVNSLKYVSFFSVLCILMTIGIVFEQFISKRVVDPTVEIWHIQPILLAQVPVVCVSFNCHYNVPRYFYELKDRSITKMWMTSLGATLIILILYLTVSISGYLLFGANTVGNILNNFPTSVIPTVARLGLGVGIICHFPIAYFAVRTNLHSLFCPVREFHSLGLRFLTACGVLLSTVTIGILFKKVEVVLGFNGSLFGSLIMFAIPGLMLIVAGKKQSVPVLHKIEAWFMLIFGLTICIGGTTLNVLNLVKK